MELPEGSVVVKRTDGRIYFVGFVHEIDFGQCLLFVQESFGVEAYFLFRDFGYYTSFTLCKCSKGIIIDEE